MGKKKRSEKPAGRQNLPADRIHYRKNKYAAPIGGIFIFLSIVGLIGLTIFCVNFTRGMLDNSREKQQFEQIIYPVLMFDPVPFEKATDADPLFLLQSSLWSTLLGEKRDSYQFDAMERLIVPSSDVDVACARLFGPDVKLEHQSFGDYETTYYYDEETKTYYVPVTGQVGLYTPSVESVVKKGDQFTVTVGYVPPANAWTQRIGTDEKPKPIKFMNYELLKVRDHYQLTAIRDLPSADGQSHAGQGIPNQLVTEQQRAGD
ncbi:MULTISPECIES: hypothetical protein [Anaerotruncus]|jgi:hypothetical protein|uniref:hypothetical protein n=1 Tax=Anaerotruncus TaxID=244127 RepID=UPI0008336B7C|nr:MULTISPECIES: hypothetical protein [Anaerotruncus]RGX56853.1 hypothetical protein DWV16_00610 [Anaerotruncus sp. AF02-27]